MSDLKQVFSVPPVPICVGPFVTGLHTTGDGICRDIGLPGVGHLIIHEFVSFHLALLLSMCFSPLCCTHCYYRPNLAYLMGCLFNWCAHLY